MMTGIMLMRSRSFTCVIQMLPLKEIGNWMQTFKTTSALLWVPLKTYSENKDLNVSSLFWGFPKWFRGKESTCQCRRHGFNPWAGKTPWGRKWQPTPVFLPGKSHGQKNLGDYSPWRCRVRHDWATKQQEEPYLEGNLENASKGVKNEVDKGRLKGQGDGVFIHPSYQC